MITRVLDPNRIPGRGSNYTRLVRYLLDPKNKHERVGEVTITNCHSTEARVAAIEVVAVQQQNRRAESDKTYHFIITFPAGEAPEPAVLRAIETRMCEALGFAEHQRVSVVHHDTDHLHIHIAVNKIHPQRFTIHNPYRDYWTRTRVCQELEELYGLQRDQHEPRRGKPLGAQDMERHTGLESLASWVKRECLTEFRAASTWRQVHDLAAQHGLTVQLRGAGCVISNGELAVRASSVARELALARLEERLGPFVPALGSAGLEEAPFATVPNRATERLESEVIQPSEPQTQARYSPAPLTSFSSGALFAQYQLERAQRQSSRDRRRLELGDRYAREITAANRKATLRRAAIKFFGGDRNAKRVLYSFAHRASKRELEAIRVRHAQTRAELYAATRRVSWTEWLQETAERGSSDALRALRDREGAKLLRGDVVGGSAPALVPIELPNGAQATKAGVLVYRLGGVVVREDARGVHVGRGASALELREVLRRALMQHGHVLAVTGAAEFQNNVVRVAAASGLPVRFADATLESARSALRRTYERRDTIDRASQGTPKSNSQRVGERTQTSKSNRVRALPARHLVQHRERGEGVLPGHVPHQLEHQGAERDQTLRRGVPRVGDSPEPPAKIGAAAPAVRDQRARGAAVRSLQPLAAATGQSPTPARDNTNALAARPEQTPRPVGAVGKAPPPPRSRHRLGSLSALKSIGPTSVEQPAVRSAAAPPSQTTTSMDAVTAYVREREEKRRRGLDVPTHVAFDGQAGTYVFAGRRLVGGCDLVLLRRDGSVFVLQVPQDAARSWERARIGQPVSVDARGRVRGRHR